MEVRIPAVKVATLFNQHVDATHEGMGAVHDRDFLMEGLDGVMPNAMGAVIQNAGDAYLGELLLRRLGITGGKTASELDQIRTLTSTPLRTTYPSTACTVKSCEHQKSISASSSPSARSSARSASCSGLPSGPAR